MKKIILLVVFGTLVAVALAVGGYYLFGSKPGKTIETPKSVLVDGKMVIPQKILDNKFGWLGGGPDDTGEGIIARGGLWDRTGPPGPFVWDMIQKSKDTSYDFTLTDQVVNNFGKNGIGLLANIFPFADWDQKNLANAADCKVVDNDEFLPENDKKGRVVYLPHYRCNPSDWVAYEKFVQAVVERYDGDGIDDMPGLIMPIKYWEVMNEPDLQYKSDRPYGEADHSTFYRQGPTEYATLLINTSKAIRLADPTVKILIAGGAGADERALSFYREVFKNAETLTAFDIGNIHCIDNDQVAHDFNVGAYKNMLAEFGMTDKPIWVTEASAMYSKIGEENYQSTKTSTTNAIAAGAERIFFTNGIFDDSRTDLSQLGGDEGNYPSEEKFRKLIESFNK